MGLRQKLKQVLNTEPKRYQIQAIRKIEKAKGRFILGDDMGLGKTLESIGWLALHPEIKKIIIVCPAAVKYQWQFQLWEHADKLSSVAEGYTPKQLENEIIIINYKILGHKDKNKGTKKKPFFPWVHELKKQNIQAIIIDEFHYIKEMTTLRTKAVQQLCKGIKYIIGASGTPIDKAPIEFFPMLQIIAKHKFTSLWKYAQKYCNLKTNFMGAWDFTGSSNIPELHKKIKPHMIRRLKINVAKELPPKIRTILPIKITNKKEYTKAENNYLQWVEETKGITAAERAAAALSLTKIGALKRIAAEGKLKEAKTWILDFLKTKNKLCIFCIHKKIYKKLHDLFPNCASITGSSKKKKEQILKFQNDKNCKIFIGQLKAAGVGIDGLQKVCSDVLFIEQGWNWSDHEQGEDRILRIGQKAKIINIFYMIAKNTVEENNLQILQHKHDIKKQILDGDFIPEELFKHRRNPNGFKTNIK